jgi:hypothetical protein
MDKLPSTLSSNSSGELCSAIYFMLPVAVVGLFH